MLLAVGSVVGGYVGARIGSYLPETGAPRGDRDHRHRGRDLPVLTRRQCVSQRNSRARDQVTTVANAARIAIGSSAAVHGSPRTITSSMPSLRCSSGSSVRERLQPRRGGVEREERAAQERHRQHQEVRHVDRALGGLGDRAGEQARPT